MIPGMDTSVKLVIGCRIFCVTVLSLFASHASALYVCTDEWGGTYLLEQALRPGLANVRCIKHSVSEKQSSFIEENKKINITAQVLGLTQPTERMPSGDLSIAVVPGIARPPKADYSRSAAQPLAIMINDVAAQYGHDANLLRAIIHVESRFNANAVSPKGAIGLMQIMPATGRSLGVEEPRRALFDPQTNVRAGAKYLRILMDKFSDRPELAIAAYNAGEGAVMRYKRDIPPYPETQSYVRQVFARYSFYKNNNN
jgi:soluble lytic murein transglycosylase-like protein